MTLSFKTIVAAAGLTALAGTASAATFAGYETTSDVIFSGQAQLDYAPDLGFGGITDVITAPSINNLFFQFYSLDPASGFATVFAPFYDGTVIDTALTVDDGTGEDELAFLLKTTVGPTPFAVAHFVGDLDGAGTTDFRTVGAFVEGDFKILGDFEILGAVESGVIPLPATLPLLLAAFGGLAVAGRRARG